MTRVELFQRAVVTVEISHHAALRVICTGFLFLETGQFLYKYLQNHNEMPPRKCGRKVMTLCPLALPLAYVTSNNL